MHCGLVLVRPNYWKLLEENFTKSHKASQSVYFKLKKKVSLSSKVTTDHLKYFMHCADFEMCVQTTRNY